VGAGRGLAPRAPHDRAGARARRRRARDARGRARVLGGGDRVADPRLPQRRGLSRGPRPIPRPRADAGGRGAGRARRGADRAGAVGRGPEAPRRPVHAARGQLGPGVPRHRAQDRRADQRGAGGLPAGPRPPRRPARPPPDTHALRDTHHRIAAGCAGGLDLLSAKHELRPPGRRPAAPHRAAPGPVRERGGERAAPAAAPAQDLARRRRGEAARADARRGAHVLAAVARSARRRPGAAAGLGRAGARPRARAAAAPRARLRRGLPQRPHHAHARGRGAARGDRGHPRVGAAAGRGGRLPRRRGAA
jgi:hypothetical protein